MTQKDNILDNIKHDGKLLHTKHAFPPNSLGYCGPDARGTIQDYLHTQSDGNGITSVLTKFEAAYPFIRMIAKSTGRDPFDYEVTEAYWLGNSLLDHVEPAEFFKFSHQDLSPSRKMVGKKDGLREEQAKPLFRQLGSLAKPHHTFYVLGMYARSSEKPGSETKVVELMDSCRISWGKVLDVKRDTLTVERPSLVLARNKLVLTTPKKQEIHYDSEIPSFTSIHKGNWVSIHWNFASENLLPYQLQNLKRYTALDIRATNTFASSSTEESRRHQ